MFKPSALQYRELGLPLLLMPEVAVGINPVKQVIASISSSSRSSSSLGNTVPSIQDAFLLLPFGVNGRML